MWVWALPTKKASPPYHAGAKPELRGTTLLQRRIHCALACSVSGAPGGFHHSGAMGFPRTREAGAIPGKTHAFQPRACSLGDCIGSHSPSMYRLYYNGLKDFAQEPLKKFIIWEIKKSAPKNGSGGA